MSNGNYVAFLGILNVNWIGILIPFIYFFSLFSHFDDVDFMSTARFGIRVMPPYYVLFIGPL
jgi:hypothetical protein